MTNPRAVFGTVPGHLLAGSLKFPPHSSDQLPDTRPCDPFRNAKNSTKQMQPDHILETGSPTPAHLPAIEELVATHATRVFAVAMRMLGNQSDAEDVTQEVMLQVVRKLDTFRGESSIATWLYRVTVNAALALRRRRAVSRERTFGDSLELAAGDGEYVVRGLATESDGPEDGIMARETRELIEDAISRLPEIYRDAFVLADVEGLPNAEIARMLGLSLPAVKSRLHRARLLMREALAPHFQEVCV